MAYSVSTLDVCPPGFERLRYYNEFILLASISAETDSTDLLEQWTSDLNSCSRPDDFDYDAARETIHKYYDETVRPLFDRRPNPFNLEPDRDESEDCTAFLFIRVDGAHFPVY